jgi:A/G-specific adenine glycosylase
MDSEINQYFVKKLLKWGRDNRRVFPWRVKPTPYNVLVSEFFLQRTPAERIATFFPSFIEKYPTIDELSRADLKILEEQFQPLGLTKRAAWLLSTATTIKQQFNGEVPDNFQDLTSLPGIGRYTASAILCFAYRHDVSIVDANVVRILKRFFGIDTSTRSGMEKLYTVADLLVPAEKGVIFNEVLLDFTASICKLMSDCNKCSLKKRCHYYQNVN